MKIEQVRVFGFEPAFHGMRNAKESWEKSDSVFYIPERFPSAFVKIPPGGRLPEYPKIGPKDMALACKLVRGGSEHRKFLRQIIIWADMTLPRYVLQELDTYKVGTVRNSCSTMHKLGSRRLTQEDFELPILPEWLEEINCNVKAFQEASESKSKALRGIRRKLKNMLPEGFLQKITYTMNYETALSMFRQRADHRLDEWNWRNPGSICAWILTLPYMKQFIEAAMGTLLVIDAKGDGSALSEIEEATR